MSGKFVKDEPVITAFGKEGYIRHCYNWDECNVDWLYGVQLVGHKPDDLVLYLEGQLRSGKKPEQPKRQRTIDDAAKALPENLRVAFKEAWYRCEVMDIYDGDPVMYMAIIVQTIRDDKARLVALRKAINISQMEINKALKA